MVESVHAQWKQQDFKARIANTPDELAQLLVPIAEAGVDVFDASTRYFNTPAFEGSPLNLAGWAKKLTGKIVLAAFISASPSRIHFS